ncbi:unnamed protein product [Pseudo-nitzschia multistriata]|uniref:Uncharacterized protein n=1 Tax=Pseudo-nitzschia multistriata TaxID=183589 RepID=A0A448ZG69_9STRA|nr:unnamed protein product [Pseudo-nitzschia multistriata]
MTMIRYIITIAMAATMTMISTMKEKIGRIVFGWLKRVSAIVNIMERMLESIIVLTAAVIAMTMTTTTVTTNTFVSGMTTKTSVMTAKIGRIANG